MFLFFHPLIDGSFILFNYITVLRWPKPDSTEHEHLYREPNIYMYLVLLSKSTGI